MHRTVALKQHLENLHKLIDTNFSDCTNQYEQKHTTEWVRHLNKSKQIIGYETPSYDNLYKYTLNAIITKGEDLATKSSGNNVKVDDDNVKTDVLNESFLPTAYQTVDLSDYTLLPPWSSNDISDHNSDNEIENDCTSIEQISKKLQFRKIINGVGTLTNMYQDNCIEMKCNPLKSVINRLERLCTGICMNLSELHLSKSKFQPLANLLKECYELETLDLSYNNFETDGLILVKELLEEFAFLTHINLSGNHLNQEGFMLLQSILMKNTQMNTLILKDAKITDNGAVMIADGLRVNTRLKMLDLSKNLIRSEGALEIAKALANSINLEWLSLHWNQIRSPGANKFGNSLGFNTSLRYLDLSWNGFNGKSLDNLGKGLTKNCHLEELNLKYNCIDLKSIISFSDCFYTNKSLKRLNLGFNPLTMAGIHGLINVIENSSNCILEELDLEGLTISETISQQVHRINRRRRFTLKIDKCIKWEPRHGKYSKTDPVTFLINYLSRHGMRLLDLYHLLDPQQTGVISEAQFMERMIKNQIPLNPDDLKTLINYIDSERTNKITYKMLASRIYFFRINVGEQLRIKATELSKHKLDQHRLFVRPEGPDILDKPPKGFPSKMKTTNSNSKSIQVSKMPRGKGITYTNKTSKDSLNGHENTRSKASYSDTKNNNSSTICTEENKSFCTSTIMELSNFYSDEFFKHKKELNNKGKPGKYKPLDMPKCKDLSEIPNQTTISTKPHILPITEVFDKKYFQDFPYL